MASVRKKGRFCSVSSSKSTANLLIKDNDIIDATGDCKGAQEPVWRIGRRIVEIGFIADQMFCKQCDSPILLVDITRETRYGLASYFDVICRDCGKTTTITSGKKHATTETYHTPCFDINTKMAAGESQLSNILAVLNIPQPSPTTLKKREREIGATIEKVAQQSCADALDEEKMAISAENDTVAAETSGAKVVLDGGWQKRRSGRTNNSMSGHLMVIGSKSKRCINFGVAKKCRICKSTGKKSTTRPHDCRKNFSGSSKAMESFLAVKTLQKIEQNGLKISHVVMDDDSTTFSRIKTSVNSNIIKCSDRNHVSKNFTNELYKIQEKHKSLTRKKRLYLQKCFNYAVAQNKGSEAGVRDNLNAIVPHVYGTHELCEDKHWCAYHQNPSSYKHQSLPHGKDFTDTDLREQLIHLFRKYLTNEMLSKLASLDSSNIIENMNQLVARKAPKALHYSESESLDYRVSAAVLQKNEGHTYICKVNEQLNLSPGKYAVNRFSGLVKKRQRLRGIQESTHHKKRRLQLKEEKRHGQVFQENIEGTTYGVDEFTPLDPEALVDVPEPLLNPGPPSTGTGGSAVVVFDLETTGFDINSDIIQIAAKEIRSGEIFSCYTYPTSGVIPDKITRLTGISMCDKELWYYGKQVSASKISESCEDFKMFMKRFSPVTLGAHNVLFDSKILLNRFHKCNTNYSDIIVGFGDTLKLFHKELPQRKADKLSFRQIDLVRDVLHKDYRAHSADEDVNILCELLGTVPNFVQKMPFYPTVDIENRITRICNAKTIMATYKCITDKGVITTVKCKSLASAGIALAHMQVVYKRSGADGLLILLKRIVASPQAVASSLEGYFSNA